MKHGVDNDGLTGWGVVWVQVTAQSGTPRTRSQSNLACFCLGYLPVALTESICWPHQSELRPLTCTMSAHEFRFVDFTELPSTASLNCRRIVHRSDDTPGHNSLTLVTETRRVTTHSRQNASSEARRLSRSSIARRHQRV